MKYSEVAARYASSLYDVAKEEGLEDDVAHKLKAFAEIISSQPELQAFLASPLIVPADKEAVLKAALQGQQLGETFTNFLLLLSKKDRLVLIEEIFVAYTHKVDSVRGITRGSVRSGVELSPEQKSEIEKKIAAAIGKKVELTYAVDPKLHGGLSAQVGSFIFDDSLSTHLNKIQDELNRRLH